ncbi:transposase, partial [Streptomyces sp. NPDC091259]
KDRLVLDSVFYVLRSGCQWRMLPRDLIRVLRFAADMMQTVAVDVSFREEESVPPRIKRSRRHGR